MDPRDFHRLASDLVKHTAAAELRTAISRAYYTTYLVALNTLRGMGCVIPENYTSHKEVVHRLSNSKNVEVERVGSQLGDLLTKRVHADYQLDRNDVESPKTAVALVKQAAQMIETLDRCCSGPESEEIVETIISWEQHMGYRL